MAERIVSPAVFTNEIDSTFLIQGISAIGGAIVGPFQKGPAYSPTIVRSVAELDDLFGTPEGKYYQPFTAREYLLEQGVCTIVRVGSLGGYHQKGALLVKATLVESGSLASGSLQEEVTIGVLANTLDELAANGAAIARADLVTGDLAHVGFEGSFVDPLTNIMDANILVDEDGNEYPDDDQLESTLHLRTNNYTENQDSENTIDSVTAHGDFKFHISPQHPNSLHNIFGRSPQKNVKPAYFTSYFENAQEIVYDNIVNGGASYAISVQASDDYLKYTLGDTDNDGDIDADDNVEPYDGAGKGEHSCRPATTPWIKSQEISGARYDLFRVHTRSFGTRANKEVKVGIYNVRTPGTLQGTDYGTFNLIVRGFHDNDKTQDVLDDYRNVTLDPLSPRYLPRVVGDRYTFIDSKGKINERGDYANGSNWIRIEMPAVSNAPTQCMPYGHGAYVSPVGGEGVPEPLWSRAAQYNRVPRRYFGGAVFNQDSPDGLLQLPNNAKDVHELFAPLPETSDIGAGYAGGGFYLDEEGTVTTIIDDDVEVATVSAVDTNPAGADAEADARGFRRFLVGFQGGFDGHSPIHPVMLGEDIRANNAQGLDCSKRKSLGTLGYERAFQSLSNQDEFDINLLVTPGLSLDLHRTVVNMGVDLCETREDCFYIVDCVGANGQPGLVDEAVTQASTIDSNYAATYYPWVKIIDPATNALQAYPPSALMPAVYAANDNTAAEWFAPAGLNRGGLEQAISVMDRLTFAERDTLYEGKVNPIAAFPGQGIVAFGQKTLQRRASALDRVNVRRLLITLKKFIASTSRYLLFEQNVAATRQRFTAIVNPYLEAVQQRQGLYAFRVIMDESNNTPDLIDRNILYGQIFLQPARAVEYIILDFTLQNTGATFNA